MTPSLLALWEEQPESNVRQRLYAVLRQSIIRMTLAPGQALSEKEIGRLSRSSQSSSLDMAAARDRF